MRKNVFLVLAMLFLATSCLGTMTKPWQQEPFGGNQVFSMVPPMPPAIGDCTELWSTTNSRCSGDIRLFEQCVDTMQGPQWESKSENCKNYGEEWTCTNNDCFATAGPITPPETITSAILLIGIIGGIILIAYLLARKWKVIK